MQSAFDFACLLWYILVALFVVVWIYNECIVPWMWKKEDEFWNNIERERHGEDRYGSPDSKGS